VGRPALERSGVTVFLVAATTAAAAARQIREG
jgi:hypothetical protein